MEIRNPNIEIRNDIVSCLDIDIYRIPLNSKSEFELNPFGFRYSVFGFPSSSF